MPSSSAAIIRPAVGASKAALRAIASAIGCAGLDLPPTRAESSAPMTKTDGTNPRSSPKPHGTVAIIVPMMSDEG